MNLSTFIEICSEKNCRKVYVKRLAANDNSKNQIYLGGSFDILNMFPIKAITGDKSGKRNSPTFKAKLDFRWVGENGELFNAPSAQFILYPEYPEVRFSGFLSRCENAPSDLMNSRQPGRILFMGVSDEGAVLAVVASSQSVLAKEFEKITDAEQHGVFSILTISGKRLAKNVKDSLLKELLRIHQLGWIYSKRLTAKGQIVPCESPNCGGFTLEAELGIPSNSKAEPDYLGWEVKNFRVANFNKINSTVISLMDHSPTDGYFKEKGAEDFIHRYGYADKKGRDSRFNFGGIHKFGILHSLTSLKLVVDGYDLHENKIIDPNGCIGLMDRNGDLAAAWSFTSLIKHWNAKHSQACFVPSRIRNESSNALSKRAYSFGNNIILGRFTDVNLLLTQICKGNVVYDPGIKLELAVNGRQKKTVKVRSLFRTKSGILPLLYTTSEVVDITSYKF